MAKKFLILNTHAIERAAQRNLSSEAIQYVITYGRRLHRAGAVFFYLRDCDIQDEDRKKSEFTRLVGTAVVLSRDQQTVLTVWRNRKNGLMHIRRKNKFSKPQWTRQNA